MLSLYLILLGIAGLGILALTLIAWSYRKPVVPKEYVSSRLSDLDEIEDDEEDETLVDPVAPISTHKSSEDTTLASLGFSALDTVLVEPDPDDAAPIIATPPQVDYHPVHKIATQNKNIIVLYLMAQPNRFFAGYELQQALLAVDLRFGEKRIFHRYEQTDGTGLILFSIASATEPGVFDVANIGAFSCAGLCIFMAPDKVPDATVTFELMLETAEQLAEDLDGVLCNEDREPITDEEIEEYRITL